MMPDVGDVGLGLGLGGIYFLGTMAREVWFDTILLYRQKASVYKTQSCEVGQGHSLYGGSSLIGLNFHGWRVAVLEYDSNADRWYDYPQCKPPDLSSIAAIPANDPKSTPR